MKKTVFAIATMFLVSCGGSTESTTTDTLSVVVDSSVTANDTGTAHIPSDGGTGSGGSQHGPSIK